MNIICGQIDFFDFKEAIPSVHNLERRTKKKKKKTSTQPCDLGTTNDLI